MNTHQTVKDRRGVTAVEYALVAALVAIAAVTILATLGTSVSRTFSKVNAELSHVSPSAT